MVRVLSLMLSIGTLLNAFLLNLLLYTPPTPAAGQETTKYLIATIPVLKQIHYAKLPDTVMRALVVSGLISPSTIAVDSVNNRLFVSDKAQFKIFWYQLITTGDGKLITDGTQHVAMEAVQANWMTVDGAGNLYYTGAAVPPPGFTAAPTVYKHGAIALATGATINPEVLWDPSNTVTMAGTAAKVGNSPSGIATNGFDVYWGNAEEGTIRGSVLRAPATPQTVAPHTQVKSVADNVEATRGMVLTPKFLFYATGDKGGQVFGVPQTRVGTCAGTTDCHVIVGPGKLMDPTGLIWDGDGTVYVADAGAQKVFTFPSGSLGEHEITEVASAPLYDIALLQVAVPGSGSFMGAAPRGLGQISAWKLLFPLFFAVFCSWS